MTAAKKSGENSPHSKGVEKVRKAAKYDLAEFRRIIWQEWKAIVGRKKLSSFEYPLIEQWFKEGVQVRHILWAIRDCHERAKRKGRTLTSLGVIAPDLARVRRQDSRMKVGDRGRVTGDRDAPGRVQDEWRAGYIEAFEEIAELHANPECAAMFRELAKAVPSLSQEEADRQYREIKSCK